MMQYILMGLVEANAREPPSQLQEALKESTKVDAEYNLPTRAKMTKYEQYILVERP
jgi:hypothetical protein